MDTKSAHNAIFLGTTAFVAFLILLYWLSQNQQPAQASAPLSPFAFTIPGANTTPLATPQPFSVDLNFPSATYNIPQPQPCDCGCGTNTGSSTTFPLPNFGALFDNLQQSLLNADAQTYQNYIASLPYGAQVLSTNAQTLNT